MTAVLREATLRLAAEPVSARAARRFVRHLLASVDREQWTEPAELAVSEVVTNAVLHAHTDLELTVRVLPQELQVEVLDGSAQLPVQRLDDEAEQQATTGRGLALVASVTAECGVRAVADGKVVWFVIRGVEPELTGPDPLDQWDLADLLPPDPAQAPPEVVLLRALPPALWLAASQHHDALLREYALYCAEHPTRSGPDLVALADQGRHWVSASVIAALGRLDLATKERPPALEVAMAVPPGAERAFLALQDVLDEAERLAVQELLLISPALPEITALRRWVCEQAVTQLAGKAAAPWPGTAQERFLEQVRAEQVRGGQDVEWDSELVTASDRGVVAANDANRILAVSAPLARALGWEVEDLVGRRIVALVPPALREAHVVGFSRHLTTGESHILDVPLRLPVLCADGTQLLCEVLIQRSRTRAGRLLYLAWMSPVAEG